MTAAVAKTTEPTMEEILASIRRIIAEDQGAAPPAAPALSHAPAASAPAAERPAPPPKPRLVDVAPPAPPPAPAAPALSHAPAASVPPPATGPALAPVIDAFDERDAGDPDALRPEAPGPARVDTPEERMMEAVPALPHILTATPVSQAPLPVSAHDSGPAEPLLSPTVDDAVGQSFGALAHAHLARNLPPLENVIREMLRPMLKNWLDDNLPSIVEKLVRAEIERVARGGRG